MPHPLVNYSALALIAQRTHVPASVRTVGSLAPVSVSLFIGFVLVRFKVEAQFPPTRGSSTILPSLCEFPTVFTIVLASVSFGFVIVRV